METIKLILGAGEPLIGRLVLFDALKLQFRELKLEKDPDCPVCGSHPSVTELIDYEAFCGIGAEPSYDGAEITAQELKTEWERNPDSSSSTCASRTSTRSRTSTARCSFRWASYRTVWERWMVTVKS